MREKGKRRGVVCIYLLIYLLTGMCRERGEREREERGREEERIGVK